MLSYKIILIGNSSVGKTSLVMRYVHNFFKQNYDSTIGASFTSHLVKVNNTDTEIRLNIWDTAGQERYRALMNMYYRDAPFCIIVFDLTDYSYTNIKYWISDYLSKTSESNPKFVLVGNKMDLAKDTTKIDEEINELINKYDTVFFKTSAKSGQNVDELFKYIAEILYNLPNDDSQSDETFNLHNYRYISNCKC
jgi:Ras-related protein Rab-5C